MAEVVWTENTLGKKLHLSGALLRARLRALLEYESGPVQDYMRNNAPWTDRTGNARGGLFARATNGKPLSIIIYHTVPYGIWLEVAHDSNYAIINPTLKAEGPRVMKSVSQLFSLMNRGA